MHPFKNQDVATIFNNYPTEVSGLLLKMRELIFENAKIISPNEVLSESLK